MSGRDTSPDTSMHASKPPASSGVLPVLGIIFSLMLIAAGVVALHDALTYAGAVDAQPWLTRAASTLNGRSSGLWMIVVAVVVALLGLWLVILAVKPRRSTALRLDAATGIFLTRGSLRRIATAAANDVPGVDITDASATQSRLTVTASNWTGDPTTAEHDINQALTERLAALVTPPAVRVHMQKPDGSP